MFGLKFSEILVIMVVALIVLGPERLPKVARMLGKGMREVRKATGDFKDIVESEFNKLDEEVARLPAKTPIEGAVAASGGETVPAGGAPAAGAPAAPGAEGAPAPVAIAASPHAIAIAAAPQAIASAAAPQALMVEPVAVATTSRTEDEPGR
ncbi:Sec-independent protein translocase protein TatB [Vulgatibacter incomptus]|uniref:Twin-arginine translocation protein TatB n=1 Tax=Vulgatibacter incomptus TaxID=1391653 RepID=A0A0K1PDA2_9BACT|nr:Sec-independent protein translocase protein TatB [Vulgatibacter incomptus]AKU91500.1 Twin-arginine translocation protein TatB [Vulgatibacter incomptus]